MAAVMMVALAAAAGAATPGLSAACGPDARAGVGTGAGSATVVEGAATEPGYRMLRAQAPGGGYLPVYFDLASESAARAAAPCLALELEALRAELGDDRTAAEWSPAVFTSDAGYLPPRGPGVKPRWKVMTDARGKPTPGARSTMIRLIPHEQVHVWQNRNGARLPRWFAEGHATWAGLRVTGAIDPAAAAQEREAQALELTLSTGPLALMGWGSVRPKREAIMRQVSAEDRAKMTADPAYTPQGAFSFTQADFIGDESNMKARYAGAWRVFDGLERRHGAAAIRAFALAATAQPGMRTRSELAALVQTHFGEALDTLLAEPAK